MATFLATWKARYAFLPPRSDDVANEKSKKSSLRFKGWAAQCETKIAAERIPSPAQKRLSEDQQR